MTLGAIAGGGGFSDSYYQPVTFGWQWKRAEILAAYAFFAPTGRFTAGATNNTGTGHWTNAPSAGETIYLTKNKGTVVSAYQMWEIHTMQRGTEIHPGQTFDLDYSPTQVIPLQKDKILFQVGLVGYGQWQLTDNTGPTINPIVASATHYAVHSLGVGANVLMPPKKGIVSFRWFKEFNNANTVQGESVQINVGITF